MSERGKKHRIFIFNEISPGEIEHLLQSRRITFDSAYAPNRERIFRNDPAKSSIGIATIHPREKSIVFGYCFNAKLEEIDIIDRFMGFDKGIRAKETLTIGFADGDLGPALAYVSKYKNFAAPSIDALKKIAEWENRFWPREDDLIGWREISVR
jgi:hypothetical protein